tara:strand:+ start:1324 stop:2130 length:807 start_codon:yes stop_codon:yes gene_type:complete
LKLWVYWPIFISTFLSAQNFNIYFQLLEEGQIQEVKDQLPELKSKYPYDPAITYLQALMNDNGDLTIIQFRQFIEKYPYSEYTDDAEMKIGEYLYARGLYGQASQQLKKITLKYKNSNHMQRSVDLLVLSFKATGEIDSAKYYVSKIKALNSELKVDHYGFKVQRFDLKLQKLISKDDGKTKASIAKDLNQPWIVQLGAFGKYNNAKRLKNMIKNAGYPIEIVEVMSNGMRLHAVRVVRFNSEHEAGNVGKKIKAQYGVNYRVLNRPK